ncbi:Retrovirus-related Pol polyprotein from transposon TNT 1-94 [Eumeta japonica]|uniref:Retrovirus-related Pol polyprotein from transposon TNT 1-94 n=1 Tax=Eumeta variegata TaxID=151549 RepID=A0A4C1ZX40_EUMVA|nr:Retrovirus-related Pol polyprotein from transposon TNT 1-94 [Eumeta japonica]
MYKLNTVTGNAYAVISESKSDLTTWHKIMGHLNMAKVKRLELCAEAASSIKHQTSTLYTPEQNGLAERMNRTLVERAKYMLFEAKLQKPFWTEAVATAAYVINRSPSRVLAEVTPYEKWTDDYYDDDDDIQRNITLRSNQKQNMQGNNFMYVMQVPDSLTVAEAFLGSNPKQWKEAMDEEYKSLLDNNTWEFTTLPDDKHSIPCKWVLKTKTDENGYIVKYKARLVIKGCSQKTRN